MAMCKDVMVTLLSLIEKVQEGETVYVDEDIWNDLYMEDEFIDLYEEEYEDWEDEDE